MKTRMWQIIAISGGALLGVLALAVTGCGSMGRGCGGGCCGGSGGSGAAPVYRPPPTASAPAHAGHVHGDSNTPAAPAPAVADSRPYGGQKTCPVMDEPLGAMGPAIPVTVQGETVYVCCKGCAAKVQRDPAKYLAKVHAERAAP